MSKVIHSSDQLDSRKYDNIFLLAKVLCLLDNDLSNQEKEELMRRFEKDEVSNL